MKKKNSKLKTQNSKNGFISYSLSFILAALLLFVSCKSKPKTTAVTEPPKQAENGKPQPNGRVEYLFEKGQDELAQGHYGYAMFYFDSAVVIAPDDPRLWERKGTTYAKLKRHDDAQACFSTALELDPRFKPALSNSARDYAMQNRKEEALSKLRQLTAIDRDAKENARKDPTYEWLWQDKDFLEIVK